MKPLLYITLFSSFGLPIAAYRHAFDTLSDSPSDPQSNAPPKTRLVLDDHFPQRIFRRGDAPKRSHSGGIAKKASAEVQANVNNKSVQQLYQPMTQAPLGTKQPARKASPARPPAKEPQKESFRPMSQATFGAQPPRPPSPARSPRGPNPAGRGVASQSQAPPSAFAKHAAVPLSTPFRQGNIPNTPSSEQAQGRSATVELTKTPSMRAGRTTGSATAGGTLVPQAQAGAVSGPTSNAAQRVDVTQQNQEQQNGAQVTPPQPRQGIIGGLMTAYGRRRDYARKEAKRCIGYTAGVCAFFTIGTGAIIGNTHHPHHAAIAATLTVSGLAMGATGAYMAFDKDIQAHSDTQGLTPAHHQQIARDDVGTVVKLSKTVSGTVKDGTGRTLGKLARLSTDRSVSGRRSESSSRGSSPQPGGASEPMQPLRSSPSGTISRNGRVLGKLSKSSLNLAGMNQEQEADRDTFTSNSLPFSRDSTAAGPSNSMSAGPWARYAPVLSTIQSEPGLTATQSGFYLESQRSQSSLASQAISMNIQDTVGLATPSPGSPRTPLSERPGTSRPGSLKGSPESSPARPVLALPLAAPGKTLAGFVAPPNLSVPGQLPDQPPAQLPSRAFAAASTLRRTGSAEEGLPEHTVIEMEPSLTRSKSKPLSIVPYFGGARAKDESLPVRRSLENLGSF